MPMLSNQKPTVLITGAAKRIGAQTARMLHEAGWNVAIHYRESHAEAAQLAADLNAKRSNSAAICQADLRDPTTWEKLVHTAHALWGRLDGLVNNASAYYATPVGSIRPEDFDELFASNLRAPLFLIQAAAPYLQETHGAIVNIVDVQIEASYLVYTAAKAGLLAITKQYAQELAPKIRVNAVSPGAIMWPEHLGWSEEMRADILAQVPLARQGHAVDIACAVRYLLGVDANYITGQTLVVDGGRGVRTV